MTVKFALTVFFIDRKDQNIVIPVIDVLQYMIIIVHGLIIVLEQEIMVHSSYLLHQYFLHQLL